MPESPRLQSLLEMYSHQPDDSFILFALAKEYVKSGNNELALEMFRKLKSKHPEYTGAYFHMVRLLLEMVMFSEAKQILNEGLAITSKLRDHHAYAELETLKEELP